MLASHVTIDAEVILKDKYLVTIKTLPDENGKVCVQDSDGLYKLVSIVDLGPQIIQRFHAWWNHDTFTIRKTDAEGNLSFMSIPKDILLIIRRAAFSQKSHIRDSMKPKDNKLEDAVEGDL